MQLSHINYDSTKLIIFFCGFYTDENCFCDFDDKRSDILYVWDYSSIDYNVFDEFDFSPYSEINLIAYSYGVWATGVMKNYLPQINKSTAICGTFMPIDNNYGVPNRIFDIMLNSLNQNTIENFERKMFCGAEIKKSSRSIENLRAELENIKELSYLKSDFDFEKVIMAKNDRIIPYSSQENFWAFHKNKITLNTGHFPFFELNNLESAFD